MASKAAVEAMCDSWRTEFAHHGVTVTCIPPPWVTPPMVERGRDSRTFRRLRSAMAGPLGKETSFAVAAPIVLRSLLTPRLPSASGSQPPIWSAYISRIESG